MSDAATARLEAFARSLAAARGMDANTTEHLWARVERLRSGYRREREWRASASLTGTAVRPAEWGNASTRDGDTGVCAHGATPDAAVDAAIAEWRTAAQRHRDNLRCAAEDYARRAARWGEIVAAIGGDR